MSIIYRKGTEADIPAVFMLIKELAIYEKAPGEVVNTPEKLLADGFGPHPAYGVVVAEDEGQVIGMALYYYRYSTWKGRTVYLEDLIVTETYRNKGIGLKLFDTVLQHAKALGCARLNWQVLDWNEPAIRFYKKFNASFDSEWLNGYIDL